MFAGCCVAREVKSSFATVEFEDGFDISKEVLSANLDEKQATGKVAEDNDTTVGEITEIREEEQATGKVAEDNDTTMGEITEISEDEKHTEVVVESPQEENQINTQPEAEAITDNMTGTDEEKIVDAQFITEYENVDETKKSECSEGEIVELPKNVAENKDETEKGEYSKGEVEEVVNSKDEREEAEELREELVADTAEVKEAHACQADVNVGEGQKLPENSEANENGEAIVGTWNFWKNFGFFGGHHEVNHDRKQSLPEVRVKTDKEAADFEASMGRVLV